MALNNLKFEMWTKVLNIIHNNNGAIITTIYLQTGCTYAHIIDIIKLLKDHNLVTTKSVGRTTKIYITRRGKIVASALDDVNRIIGGI